MSFRNCTSSVARTKDMSFAVSDSVLNTTQAVAACRIHGEQRRAHRDSTADAHEQDLSSRGLAARQHVERAEREHDGCMHAGECDGGYTGALWCWC